MCNRHAAFLGSAACKVAMLGVGIACATAPVAAAQKLDVVTSGLKNPRGMSFGPGGALYVAEAGRGGSGPCIPAATPGPPTCYGATGSITRVDVRSGVKRRIVNRLPSLSPQQGEAREAIGPQDISFSGRTGYFTLGLGANPVQRAKLGAAGPRFAGVYKISPRGRVSRLADLGAYEAKRNPDAANPGAEIDSNPYSIDATRPERILVTDAGANDLLRLTPSGSVTTLAVFPFGKALAPPFLGLPPGTEIPLQPVPTGVVRGRGGNTYIGQLTGFPFPVGAASVFRTIGANKPTVLARGLTTIIDVAVGRNNSVYVLQVSTTGLAGPPSPGKLIRIAANGTQTELAAGMLQQPTGLAVSTSGEVYVANKGMSPSNAQIVHIH